MDENLLLNFIVDNERFIVEVWVDLIQVIYDLRKGDQSMEEAGGFGTQKELIKAREPSTMPSP